MKRCLLSLLVLISLGQLGVGAAHADDDSFLAATDAPYIPNVRFNQPSSWLLNTGYQVCADTLAGKPQLRIIRDVRYNGVYNLDAVQATLLVNIAQKELCGLS